VGDNIVTFTELCSIDSESSEKKILVSKCVFVVAELLFGHQTSCMLPRSISTASLAFWATQMGYVVHHAIGWVKMGSRRRLGYSDPIRPVRRQGPPSFRSRSAGGPFGLMKSFSMCFMRFLCFTLHNGSGHNHGPLRKRRVIG
jgi:hypothetical protein